MFFKCSNLLNLPPNIGYWAICNVKNMSYMFSGCLGLMNLSSLSKWKIKEDVDITNIFEGCNSNLNTPKNFNNNKSTGLFDNLLRTLTGK